MNEPYIHVGILFAPQIRFTLVTPYRINGHTVTGTYTATYAQGHISWEGKEYEELSFEPVDEASGCFELHDVTIGIGFHWQREENQRFHGALRIIMDEGRLTAVNVIRAETYLVSVISSEMKATAPMELLKAHAVISRSWLLACLHPSGSTSSPSSTDTEKLRWYERDAHTRFDICADDHCQRYQGITRASTENAQKAVADTWGEVLTWENQLCDTRFSKCCGGALEEFQYCWANLRLPYLHRGRDWRTPTGPATDLPDLTREAEAERWIRSTPPSFCDTKDKSILSQVLNNYDQETTDFYRWRVAYTQEELSRLIRQRTGIDFGRIIDLIPIARGTSGRLWQLKIEGTRQSRIIGKELEIRRTLSPTHLYSSAFVVEKHDFTPDGLPGRFLLIGAGWGHGVGLCQIGAAVMAGQGYGYREILHHYYPGAKLQDVYTDAW